jgi:hypothetical protein
MNSTTGNDIKSLKEMYIDMTNSRSEELNLECMQNEYDRGYKKESFLNELDDWNGLHRGTHPRTPCLESFPYTFGHPQDVRNIEDSGPSIARFSERGTKGLKGYMCATAYRDFKGSVVLMSTNHKSFAYPVHRSYQDFCDEEGSLTINNIDDTIEGALFSSSDEDDSSYEVTHSVTNSDSGHEGESDSESSGVASCPTSVENISPALGAVVSSQRTLVGDEYGDDSETSSESSVAASVVMTTRLSSAAAVSPFEHVALSDDSDDYSQGSHNESSETDSDTSDDDVMYSNRQRQEPTKDDGVRLKNSKPNEMPTSESLVRNYIYYAIGFTFGCDCNPICTCFVGRTSYETC